MVELRSMLLVLQGGRRSLYSGKECLQLLVAREGE